MCNRYLNDATWEEELAYYREIDAWRSTVTSGVQLSNYASEVYPGYKGVVFAEGGLQAMTWGFPRVMMGKSGKPLKPRPINNTRSENLGSPFWRSSFESRRCLIPVTRFAEAEGAKGSMTCTWMSVPGAPIFSVAGIWRDSSEWGRVYSMMMTTPCDATACVHDRMPVILRREDYGQWLGGEPREALELCRPWEGAIAIDRTEAPWFKR